MPKLIDLESSFIEVAKRLRAGLVPSRLSARC
jgi:hypothetical protein